MNIRAAFRHVFSAFGRTHCQTPLLLLCLTPALLFGCADAEQSGLAEEKTRELELCRKENQELRLRLQEQKQTGTPASAAAAKPLAELQVKEERIRQLEATLNRAYIDMKAALMERDAYAKQVEQLRGKRRN